MEECKYEEVDKEETEKEPPSLSYFQLYKFSSTSERALLIVGALCGIISGVCESLFFLYYGKCIGAISEFETDWSNAANASERARTDEEYSKTTKEFAIIILLCAATIFCNLYISTFIFNYTAMKQTFRIRQLYFSSVVSQDISWHDQCPTGDFASRISDDLAKFQDGINDKVSMSLHNMSMAFASLIQGLVVGWELAVVGLVTTPISLLVMNYIGKLTAKIAQNESEVHGFAGRIADEALMYIKTVVAFDGREKELERYKSCLLLAKKSNVKKHFLTGLLEGVMNCFISITSAIFVWYAAKLMTQTDPGAAVYNLAKFTTVYYSIISIIANTGATVPYLQGFNVAKGAAQKVFSTIQQRSVINQSYKKGLQLDGVDGNINFQNVTFSYPARRDVTVLKELNLKIKSRETVALVGSSGCGKSTIVQLIQRFYDPIHGNIYVDDHDLTGLNLVGFRKHIGMVGQEAVLFNETIAENIRLGNLDATQIEIEEAAQKANAHSFILSFPKGYQTLVGERGTQLSGGQKQRIAIARALVRKPSILLLDEATSALDSNSEAIVQATIDEISKECTTVIVAHRLSSVRKADRILVMSGGKIVEDGSHDDLMLRRGAYHNLVVSQLSASEGEEKTKHSLTEKESEGVTENIMTTSTKKEKLNKETVKLSTIWSMIWGNLTPGWCVMLGVLFQVTSALCNMVFAIFMGKSFTELSLSDPAEVSFQANINGGSFIVLGVLLLFLNSLQSYLTGTSGENLIVNLRSSMFQTMTLQKLEWFDRSENGVGFLSARLAGEPSNVQTAITFCVRPLLHITVMSIFLICTGLYWCWKVLLAIFCYMPLLVFMLYLEHIVLVKEKQKSGAALNQSTMLAVEGINSIRTVASLTIEELLQDVYKSKLRSCKKLTIMSFHIQSAVFGFIKCAATLSHFVTVFYGSQLIKSKEIEASNVIAISFMFAYCLWNYMLAVALMPNLVSGFVACSNIKDLLDLRPKNNHQFDEDECKSLEGGDVDYRDVFFSYPTRLDIQILGGLNLKVLKGKTVALVGPSGCGKSTIVQLLERFYDASSGRITFGEDDITKVDLQALRYRLGIVMQEPCLFSKTIGENIAYGISQRVSGEKIIEAAKKANIHGFISSLPLGYDTQLGEKGTQLSGGQKQRIAIARAVIRDPEVLLLDEATSALDAESEKVVQDALNHAREEKTCIVIAHRLATIVDSDLIAVIDQGKVAEVGTHQELIEKRNLYWKLHNMYHRS